MTTRSVAELVNRSRGGDQEAFGRLVDRYQDMVYGLAFHLTGRFEEARDLTQEAFVQAYLKLGQLREANRFGGWLRQITVNLHRMQARVPTVATVPLDEEVEAVPQAEPSEIEVVVREALGRLRAPERLALTLHYIDGYSQAEIGAFLGVDAATIKGRLARARHHLREEVMQMVEEVFDQNALPPEFARDVIRAVNDLVANLRAALPPDLEEVCRSLRRRRNETWRAVLEKVPETLLPRPLQVRGQARPIPVADLPEELRERAREAACLTWFDWVADRLARAWPWTVDFEVLWVRFYEHRGWYAWLADVPGDMGNIASSIPIDPEARNPQARESGAADVTTICRQPPEFQGAFRKLRRAIPYRAGTLGEALYAAMAAAFREARDQLPEAARAVMAAGKTVSVRELPEPVREALRRAVHLHWGSELLAYIEHPPSWLTQFDAGSVEWGLFRESVPETLVQPGSREYVLISGPEGPGFGFLAGIGKALDTTWPFGVANATA